MGVTIAGLVGLHRGNSHARATSRFGSASMRPPHCWILVSHAWAFARRASCPRSDSHARAVSWLGRAADVMVLLNVGVEVCVSPPLCQSPASLLVDLAMSGPRCRSCDSS
eukprot:2452065-Pleurochrysis_carterae.AAC.1